MSIELGLLEEVVNLKSVWPHEALSFTPWLAENIDILNQALGLNIVVEERESSVGTFHVDIYGLDESTGRKVVIENQLEDTNHDHLGKLITYASGKSAGIVIWIVRSARPEHRAAIEWLNEHTDDTTSFFLCEIKLYRIGESPVAAKFEVVESPNDWSKVARSDGKEMSASQQSIYTFWSEFFDYAYADGGFTDVFGRRSPSSERDMNFFFGAGKASIVLRQIPTQNLLMVSFSTYGDSDIGAAFGQCYEKDRNMIAREIGCELKWVTEPGKVYHYARTDISIDYQDHASWQPAFERATEIALKMKAVFWKHITAVMSGESDEP